MGIEIPLKGNKVIMLESVIQLTTKQWAKIFERSPLKTEKQWLQPKTKGVKIKLTPDQRREVLAHKDECIQSHTVDSLLLARMIRFTDHGLELTSERIDKKPPEEPPSEEAMRAMVDLVIHSNEVSQDAEWRGYPSLSYSFKGIYGKRECSVVIVFDGPVLVITEVTETGETINVTSLMKDDQLQKLKAFRDKL